MNKDNDFWASDFASPARPEVCDERSSTVVRRESSTGRERRRGEKDPPKI